MKRVIFLLLLIACRLFAFGQDPKVPNKMKIGDLQIKITDDARAEIQKNVDELTKLPKYFNIKVDRANQYFHFIEDAFMKEGVPDDIKYLVLQESGLISDAVSTSNAVGYWQFKDFTAVEMGMRVDRHVDERKNIFSASIAAAKYMNRNNEYFDNWIYAIQAYQMGAGGALKATDKKLYGAKSMTITKKTYWYVKKYIAHKVAYENAVGKSRPSVYLSAYKGGANQSLHDIAKKFKIDEKEVIKYNKWLKKGKVPTDKMYAVIIPDKQMLKIADDTKEVKPKSILVRQVPIYNQSQAKLFPAIKKWKGNKKYSGSTISINRLPGVLGKKGDKLAGLALKGSISLGDFLEMNDIEIDHKVVEGTPYYFKKKKSKARVYYHIVREGENFWTISQKYGVKLKKILIKNRLTKTQNLKEGRVLWVRHIRPEKMPVAYEKIDNPDSIKVSIEQFEKPEERLPVADTLPKTKIDTLEYESENYERDSSQYQLTIHTVGKGNTYYNIANKYSVKVSDVAKWNNLKLTDKLAIGQELNIYTLESKEPENSVETAVPQPIIHIVEKGETLYSISRKYNITTIDLQQYNSKTEDTVSIGEELKIPVKD